MSITKRDRYVVNILDNHIKCATVKYVYLSIFNMFNK